PDSERVSGGASEIFAEPYRLAVWVLSSLPCGLVSPRQRRVGVSDSAIDRPRADTSRTGNLLDIACRCAVASRATTATSLSQEAPQVAHWKTWTSSGNPVASHHAWRAREFSFAVLLKTASGAALAAFPYRSRTRKDAMPWVPLLTLLVVVLTGCAPEVVRRPTEFTPATDGADGTIEVLTDLPIAVGPGCRRGSAKGSVWRRRGRTREGDVYKPIDRVFTVEGAQVHEAYLVLNDDRIVGFYLPVERAFSPAPSEANIRLTFQR